jgi:pyruvate kinase
MAHAIHLSVADKGSVSAQPSILLTKIIATAGPACSDPKTLCRLIEYGVRVFRLNFSHGDLDGLVETVTAIRAASAKVGIEVGILGDLSGPKIRLGKVDAEGVVLSVGDRVRFVRHEVCAAPPAPGGEAVFSLTWPSIIDDVQVGERVLIDDGAVRTLAIECPETDAGRNLIVTVTTGGVVSSAKGVNLPDTDLNVPATTEHDWRCVDWAIAHDLDFLAMSFVRRAEELRQLRSYLAQHDARQLPIVAKIERPEALNDLEAIIAEADAVMVARGDLGVEMDLVKVPIIQKRIMSIAHAAGKPVIVATQMLQSMIESAVPTRAEVSDVANAIFEGADAVMLSGETAVGRYPVEAVHVMGRIALGIQEHIGHDPSRWGRAVVKRRSRDLDFALAHGVATVARDLDTRLIVVWSQSGHTARYLSQNRPSIPIIAVTSDPRAMRRMCLLFAVWPVQMASPGDIEDFVSAADDLLTERDWAGPGDAIVLVAGEPLDVPGATNTLRIHYVGNACRNDLEDGADAGPSA